MQKRTTRAQAPPRASRLRRACRGWALATAFAFTALAPTVAQAEKGLELTSSTRQTLRYLQELWDRWTSALYQNEQEEAQAAVEEMMRITAELGMNGLTDFSLGAAVRAVEAAHQGQFERAEWALEAARQLDPLRPETAFARATVERLQGNYLGAAGSLLEGWIKTLSLRFERRLILHNTMLWGLYTLLIAAALFTALLLATRSAALIRDLSRFAPGEPGSPTALAVVVVALVWPILLPSGLLWLALWWSVLVWAYSSTRQRATLVVLWLLLGALPLGLALEHQHAQLASSPPTRFLDRLATRHLYGTFFSDLEVLRDLFPRDDPAVIELVADLHQQLNQWENAQEYYRELLENDEQDLDAMINLGVFYHQKSDHPAAVSYFRMAISADPTSALAHYDLSQAYSQSYRFDESHEYLARAKELDSAQVDRWIASSQGSETVFVSTGGRERMKELADRLEARLSAGERPFADAERFYGFGVALAVLLLALAFERFVLGRDDSGVLPPAHGIGERHWSRALVPGLGAAREGQGTRALFALFLPVALVTLPMIGRVGYSVPFGYSAGYGFLSALSLLALALFFGLRLLGARPAGTTGKRG